VVTVGATTVASKAASLAAIMFLLLAVNLISTGLEPPYRERTVKVSGIMGTACVEYSRLGVPYIRADNPADAFFALGYAMAADRLLQMDILRRATAGFLSEVLGAGYVEVDYLIRHMHVEVCGSLSEELSELLSAYSMGVNAYIENSIRAPARLLAKRCPRWRVEDSLRILGMVLVNPIDRAAMELTWSAIYARYGRRAMGLLPEGFKLDDKILSSGEALAEAALALCHVKEKVEKLGLPSLAGFAVASPGFLWCGYASSIERAPAPYYLAAIEVNGLTVYGVFIPGVPLPVAWSTEDLAGALVSLCTDSIDIYMGVANGTHILRGSTWYPLRRKEVKIRTPSGVVEKPSYSAFGVSLAEVHGCYLSFKSVKVSWRLLDALFEAIVEGDVDTVILEAPPVAIVLTDGESCDLVLLGSYPDVKSPSTVKPIFNTSYAWRGVKPASEVEKALQKTSGVVVLYPVPHWTCLGETTYYASWGKHVAYSSQHMEAIMEGYDPFAIALLRLLETHAGFMPQEVADLAVMYAFEEALLKRAFGYLRDLYKPYIRFRQWALARLIYMLTYGDIWLSEVAKTSSQAVAVEALHDVLGKRKPDIAVSLRHLGLELGLPLARMGNVATRGVHAWVFSGGAGVVDAKGGKLKVSYGLAAAFAKLPDGRVIGILYSGEGGHWLSPNYMNQLRLWKSGRYVQLRPPAGVYRRMRLRPRG